ncbi:unnamed protein product [Candidula unifasciata]|uniref:RING-type domain-containing protein n=1 Tax=Candidula unifasciata TaxID=100452 RepID=A0A8S3Z7P9_9EUPU|nr:unnamed protein product [Candidula unifasciata]
MPAGISHASLKSKKKEDVSQKIQEIKQRQQNWFRQREKTKLQPNIDEHKYRGWNEAENQTSTHNENTPDFNDMSSIRSGTESELERLVSPDQSPQPYPVSEEEFPYLAEKIASKVKKDLGIPHSYGVLSGKPPVSVSTKNYGDTVWNTSRHRTFVKEERALNHTKTPALSSHNCSICRTLMLSSKNLPTMVIPCGHTFCKSCLEDKQSCPSCDCPVLSLTVNIMLQQVIQEYHASHGLSRQNTESLGSAGSCYAVKHSQSPYMDGMFESDKTSYDKKLENMEIRHSILLTEYKTLVKKQQQVTQCLHQEQTQSQNIRKQEDEVQKAMSDLQERLKTLKEHRMLSNNHIIKLQDERSHLEGKISLLAATVTSLINEIDKVKMLSESGLQTNIG